MLERSTSSGCERGPVSVGRLESGDRAAVLEVFEGLSGRSRRLRFHGPKPRLAARELEDLVEVGCCGREAVAAFDPTSGGVGIARSCETAPILVGRSGVRGRRPSARATASAAGSSRS